VKFSTPVSVTTNDVLITNDRDSRALAVVDQWRTRAPVLTLANCTPHLMHRHPNRGGEKTPPPWSTTCEPPVHRWVWKTWFGKYRRHRSLASAWMAAAVTPGRMRLENRVTPFHTNCRSSRCHSSNFSVHGPHARDVAHITTIIGRAIHPTHIAGF